jgi:hypothetical protein
MGSGRPYFLRRVPAPQSERDFLSDGTHVDLSNAHLPAYGTLHPVAAASALFDRRAAAVVRAGVALDGVGGEGPISVFPRISWHDEKQTRVDVGFGHFPGAEFGHRSVPNEPWFRARDLLELKWYDDAAPTVYLARSKCLAALAYLDYFPDQVRKGQCLRALVSAALTAASPGWCGTFGPGLANLTTDRAVTPLQFEGNYEFNQMALLAIAYGYYDVVSPAARSQLITVLLANGRIHRPGLGEDLTSGEIVGDWREAGEFVPETENHILCILTARYLTNQLLYQRSPLARYDNRRNSKPSCFEILLALLRNFLRDDFSEYNAKDYQEETRWALLNLCTYAYDHEVRLAARMVLDYVSAHFAVSSNDLRRMVPFRRRNQGKNVTHDPSGFMRVGLLEFEDGADPLVPYLALQAGNLRAFARPSANRDWEWGLRGGGSDLMLEILSDYRLPPAIHGLFVDDDHRRFFQRLRRVDPHPLDAGEPMAERRITGDSLEIYASSPSYLISAGGEPTAFAGPVTLGTYTFGDDQQRGVAVTTSFIPTGETGETAATERSLGLLHYTVDLPTDRATGLIQLGAFDDRMPTQNYGVAPDFACGHRLYVPAWLRERRDHPGYLQVDASGAVVERPDPPGFIFINRGSRYLAKAGHGRPPRASEPGFYLAIYEQEDGFGLLEALDTWLHPEVTFEVFKAGVLSRNGRITLRNGIPSIYRTHNGGVLHFEVWAELSHGFPAVPLAGARVLAVGYGLGDPHDAQGDAGNQTSIGGEFLRGTILNSRQDGVVEITNPVAGTTLRLDLEDPLRPKRTTQSPTERVVEVAGDNREVWLDFDWPGPNAGDVCQPFSTLAAASAAVAPGGVVRMVPGAGGERGAIGKAKAITLLAPIGGVTIGRRGPAPGGADEPNGEQGLWVDSRWSGPDAPAPLGSVLRPFDRLSAAVAVVPDRGVITVMPDSIAEGSALRTRKRFTVSAPLGRVTLRPDTAFPPFPPWTGGVKPL